MCYTIHMHDAVSIKESVRQRVLELGADVCGFAGMERFRDAPGEFAPAALFPACKTVICFGIALPNGLSAVAPRFLYGHYNHLSCAKLDRITLDVALYLEDTFSCLAVPLPCDGPYEAWDAMSLHGHGLLSVKHAAVNAGLGRLGKSTLLLHEKFGNRLTLGAVLTDLAIPSDPLAADICLPGCTRCIDSCPADAIRDGFVEQRLCRAQAYGKTARGFDTVDCNRCRTVCPMQFGVHSHQKGETC